MIEYLVNFVFWIMDGPICAIFLALIIAMEEIVMTTLKKKSWRKIFMYMW